MSDQSSLNSGATGDQGGAAAPAKPVFSSLDVNDQLTNLDARLSALEAVPAVAAGSTLEAVHVSALARLVRRVFGEDLGE